MTTLPVTYGRCPCSGQFANRVVEVRMTIGGRALLLDDVSQGACPNCGSRVYRPDVLERIEGMMFASALDERDERALRRRERQDEMRATGMTFTSDGRS